MKTLVPSYYNKFKCIKGRCKHSCCKNWEIDIDKSTLDYYNILPTKLGEKIRENLTKSLDGNFTCFKNLPDGRCPFLNDKGLCDIITELGDESICQICTDHPRFRNYRENVVEKGIGLSCEAACKIILLHKGRVRLILDDEISCERLKKKSKIGLDVDRIRKQYIDRAFCSESVFKEMLNSFKDINLEEYISFLYTLEYLDREWNILLKDMKAFENIPDKYINEYRQLFQYFIYRHLSKSETYKKEYLAYLNAYYYFAILSINTINSICITKYGEGYSFENLCDVTREYSEEIEYSEQNMSSIIDILIRCN